MTHLLVTNDFPPKVGGIQSYLSELWRRLPPERVVVLTTPYDGDQAHDRRQRFRIERTPQRVLLPTPALARTVRQLAQEAGARLVVLDPAVPLGLLGPRLGHPYAVLVHGAELTVPGRLPGTALLTRHVLRAASRVIAGGRYAAAEARRAARSELPITEVPPGVDLRRFRPLDMAGRERARARFGLPNAARLVLAVTRLVPRKGMDTLVRAAAGLAPGRSDLVVAIAGNGRDRTRLERLVRHTGAPVRFLGSVADDALPDLYACADVFALPCRTRWGGLEQEGFGIVFLEAAASGIPQVAGDSGGAREVVADGETGFVVDAPDDPDAVGAAHARLLDDRDLRLRQGRAARRRAEEHFDYDRLAGVLDAALAELE